jgi:hypothetical protein
VASLDPVEDRINRWGAARLHAQREQQAETERKTGWGPFHPIPEVFGWTASSSTTTTRSTGRS